MGLGKGKKIENRGLQKNQAVNCPHPPAGVRLTTMGDWVNLRLFKKNGEKKNQPTEKIHYFGIIYIVCGENMVECMCDHRCVEKD